MAVNNEIGTIQPIKEIGAIVKKHKGVYFHTDAAQAVGKIPMNVDEMGIDLMSISGHKVYGPKGVGACYVRRRPRVRLEPLISGGGQERGLRSGTVAAPLAVGFGEACRIAKKEMSVSSTQILREPNEKSPHAPSLYTRRVEGHHLDKLESHLGGGDGCAGVLRAPSRAPKRFALICASAV